MKALTLREQSWEELIWGNDVFDFECVELEVPVIGPNGDA